MNQENDAVKQVIMDKAGRMKGGLDPKSEYNEHIKKVLNQLEANASEEQVRIFVAGAVDAMIFDVAGSLDCPDLKRHDNRQRMLAEIFPKK